MIEYKNNRINIDEEGKKQSELSTSNREDEITLNITNLEGLVQVNGENLTDLENPIKDDDEIIINSQNTETTGILKISLENIVKKEIQVSIAQIRYASDIAISDKNETQPVNKIYTLKVNNENTKNMAINTGTNNSVGMEATITATGEGLDEDVLWKSENNDILTVNTNGDLIGKSEGTTKLIATTSISGKTDEVEVTVTKYGEPVDYSVTVENTLLDDWKIFYAEGANTFLIYGDYLPNAVLGDGSEGTIKAKTKLNPKGLLRIKWSPLPAFQPDANNALELFKGTKYGLVESKTNSKLSSTLLNTSNWDSLLSTTLKQKAEQANATAKAIGSPTVEMWIESWNDVYPRDWLLCERVEAENPHGYLLKTSNSSSSSKSLSLKDKAGYQNKLYFNKTSDVEDPDLNNENSTAKCKLYCISSPSSFGAAYIFSITRDGNLTALHSSSDTSSMRPVICIPSSIIGNKNNDGKWTIK